jgi:hypothetical protein
MDLREKLRREKEGFLEHLAWERNMASKRFPEAPDPMEALFDHFEMVGICDAEFRASHDAFRADYLSIFDLLEANKITPEQAEQMIGPLVERDKKLGQRFIQNLADYYGG